MFCSDAPISFRESLRTHVFIDSLRAREPIASRGVKTPLEAIDSRASSEFRVLLSESRVLMPQVW